jgi:alanine dehydrogenase
MRALTAAPVGSRFMGAKVFGFGRQKNANYLIALFDQDSGLLTALVDGNVVTGLRTAATTAVVIEKLTPNRALRVGILGSGHEAHAHLQALASARPIETVSVFSPTESKRAAFAHDFQSAGIHCSPVSEPAAAVAGADVVIAAARSYGEKPILRGEWLDEQTMVASIGSTLPEQREIDEKTIDRSDLIVCDMPDEVVAETGDMLAAAAAGISFDSKIISLNDLMSGLCDARAAQSRRPLYKSVGSAIQDVVVAGAMFEKAEAAGLAVSLPAPFLIRR